MEWKNLIRNRTDSFLCVIAEIMPKSILLFRFRVHRHIIVESSEYFESLLLDTNTNSLNLTHIDDRTLEEIIHFIYIGYVELNAENIDRILPAASCMRITLLVERCVLFLESHLAVENCVKYLLLADRSHLEDGQLKKNAMSLICAHFANILNTDDFMRINGNNFIQILRCDNLGVPEIDIFNCLVKWKQRNPAKRAEFMPELLNSIRLHNMTGEVNFIRNKYSYHM